MSYDTSQYIGLGIKVRDILAAMDGAESAQIAEDGALYVQINEALIKSYNDLRSNGMEEFPSSEKLSKIDFDQYMTSSRDGHHVTSCIAITLLSLCGIKPEYINKGEFCSFELSLMPYGEVFVPTEGTSATCPSGFVYLKSELSLLSELFIPALKEEGLVTCFEQEYDDDYNLKPLFDINMAKSLSNLLDSQTATAEDSHGHEYGPQELMSFLLDKYLETKEIYADTSVHSTRYGDVHEHGGMEEDEPYLIFGGELSELDEEGDWGDPRKDDSELVEEVQKALVGEDHEGFSVLKPIFGG